MNKNLQTILIAGGAVVVVVLSVLPFLFGQTSTWQGTGWGMMGPGMMGGFGGMWLMPLIPIVVVGLIVWAVVAAVQGTVQPRGPEPPYTESALEVLKRRYARGEINKEEFEEKRKDLV